MDSHRMNTRSKNIVRSNMQSNTLSSKPVPPRFNVTTFVSSGARPIFMNGHWKMRGPTYGFHSTRCDENGEEDSSKTDKVDEMNGVEKSLVEIMYPDENGIIQVDSSIYDHEDEKTSNAFKRDLEYINSWRTDRNFLNSTSDELDKYNEELPERWNNVFSFGLKHLVNTNKVKKDMISSIQTLDSLKDENEIKRQSIMKYHNIDSAGLQRDIVGDCVSNVYMPYLWLIAGSGRDIDSVNLEDFTAHNSNITTSSGTIKKNSNLISLFCNTSPYFVARVIPALDPKKSESAAEKLDSFRKSVSEKGRKIFAPLGPGGDEFDSIHEINYFNSEADTKEEYAKLQFDVISARDKKIRNRLKTISDSVKTSLNPSSDFGVKVVTSREFDHYEHNLGSANPKGFIDWERLDPLLQSEFKKLTHTEENEAESTNTNKAESEAKVLSWLSAVGKRALSAVSDDQSPKPRQKQLRTGDHAENEEP